MDWADIRANWPALTGAILTRWPDADEDAVLALDGDRPAFVSYVSRLENIPQAVAEDRVAEWAQTAMPADAHMEPVHDAEALAAAGAALPPGEEPLDADEAFGAEDAPARPMGRTD